MTEKTTALAVAGTTTAAPPRRVEGMRGVRIESLDDLARFCGVLAKSGFFKDSRDASQAMVKVQYGMEIGVSPVLAMTGIHIVEGKPSVGAGLIAARIKASGRYDYRVARMDAVAAEVDFYELLDGKREHLGRSVFTMKQAESAELAGRNIWRKYPQAMLFARAISQGARWHCPDVLMGSVYTPEEISSGDVEDDVVMADVRAAEKEAAQLPPNREPTSTPAQRGVVEGHEVPPEAPPKVKATRPPSEQAIAVARSLLGLESVEDFERGWDPAAIEALDDKVERFAVESFAALVAADLANVPGHLPERGRKAAKWIEDAVKARQKAIEEAHAGEDEPPIDDQQDGTYAAQFPDEGHR